MRALINGEAYSWSQIKVNIMGVRVAGVTAVDYEDNQKIEDNYGVGERPVSRSYGPIETKASITLHMVEIEALQAASSTGSLADIPEFDIVISYQPKHTGKIVNHTLSNCRFKGNKRSIKQGDKEISAQLDLACAEIKWK